MPNNFDVRRSIELEAERFSRGLDHLASTYSRSEEQRRRRRQELQDILDARNYSDQVRSDSRTEAAKIREETRRFDLEDESRREATSLRMEQKRHELMRQREGEATLRARAEALGIETLDDQARYRNPAELQKELKPAAKRGLENRRAIENDLEDKEQEMVASFNKRYNEIDPISKNKALEKTVLASKDPELIRKLTAGKATIESLFNSIANARVLRRDTALIEAATFRENYLKNLADEVEPKQQVMLDLFRRDLNELQTKRTLAAKSTTDWVSKFNGYLDADDIHPKKPEAYGPPPPPDWGLDPVTGLFLMPRNTTPTPAAAPPAAEEPPGGMDTPVSGGGGFFPNRVLKPAWSGAKAIGQGLINAYNYVGSDRAELDAKHTLGAILDSTLGISLLNPTPNEALRRKELQEEFEAPNPVDVSGIARPSQREIDAAKAARDERIAADAAIRRSIAAAEPTPILSSTTNFPPATTKPRSALLGQMIWAQRTLGSNDPKILNQAAELLKREKNFSDEQIRNLTETAQDPDSPTHSAVIALIKEYVQKVKESEPSSINLR